MRSLKIIISLLVCMAMVLSFAACGKQTGNSGAVAEKIAELTGADYKQVLV